jgi:DNA replication and repair protein RecF
MPITLLRLANFRNIAYAELKPLANGLNVIEGKNGSGKTSLLEAIFYLSMGKSFRSTQAKRLIRHGHAKLTLFAQLKAAHDAIVSLGLERTMQSELALRIGEKPAQSISELAEFLPIRLFDLHSHSLLEGSPSFRRHYLNWGLFYQEPTFLNLWRVFNQVLKQRNQALRLRQSYTETDSWSQSLIVHSERLQQLHKAYIEQLLPILSPMVAELLPGKTFNIHYLSGWPDKQDYSSVLAQHLTDDYQHGYTQYGLHRFDLEILIDDIPAKHVLSRGQQKLLICAMIMAQGELLTTTSPRGLVYLLDDLPAELDVQNRQKLIAVLTKQKNIQIFITAIARELVLDKDQPLGIPVKVFHVEHGQFDE